MLVPRKYLLMQEDSPEITPDFSSMLSKSNISKLNAITLDLKQEETHKKRQTT
jgi:hypothetical protein